MAPVLNEIFYDALEHFYGNFISLVKEYRQPFLVSKALEYAAAIKSAGAPLEKFVGFFDGTNLYVSRPKGSVQRATYSGHKRNCIKFQALRTPDCLIFHLFGPVEGPGYDMTVFRGSGIEQKQSSTLLIEESQFCIYGDLAYVMRQYLIIGYRDTSLTEAEKEFNKKMSACPIGVEWTFKETKKFFSHVASASKRRIGHTPAALWYYVSGVLWNFRGCLDGIQSETFFNCPASSLEQYIVSSASQQT